MEIAQPLPPLDLSRIAPEILERLPEIEYSWMYDKLEELNLHSPWIAEHSVRVAEKCFYLGLYEGLSEHEISLVTASGFMHDIGKINIPNALLNNFQTKHKRKIFAPHVMYGYNILKNIPSTNAHIVADIMIAHHKFQPDSYPNEYELDSTSDLFPLQQILATADATDALLNVRPYQKAHTEVETLNLLTAALPKPLILRAIEVNQRLI